MGLNMDFSISRISREIIISRSRDREAEESRNSATLLVGNGGSIFYSIELIICLFIFLDPNNDTFLPYRYSAIYNVGDAMGPIYRP